MSERHRLELLSQRTAAADPAHILKRGYSITLHNGRAVRSAADLKQVFTRTLIGPADHTFCYPVAQYRGAIKTNAYSLAAPILYYGALSSPYWYGNPDVYSSGDYPELKFWNDMPGEWDESRHIDSRYGEYFTMARRSGEEWFLGSLSAVELRATFPPSTPSPSPRTSPTSPCPSLRA